MIFLLLFWQDAAAAIDNMVRTLFPLACGDAWLCRLPRSMERGSVWRGLRGENDLCFPLTSAGILGGTVVFYLLVGFVLLFFLCRMSLSSLAGQFV